MRWWFHSKSQIYILAYDSHTQLIIFLITCIVLVVRIVKIYWRIRHAQCIEPSEISTHSFKWLHFKLSWTLTATCASSTSVAIGTYLTSLIANAFTAHLNAILMKEIRGIAVCKWHRYVHDTFVLVKLNAYTYVVDIIVLLNGFS
jgi:hypothetical protein